MQRLLASRSALLSPTSALCYHLTLQRSRQALRDSHRTTSVMATTASSPAFDSNWKHISKGGIPPYHIFGKPVEKSQQDDRDYRIIKLDNGLEAMLVHDAKADKAAASLDVAVGHLYDPDDMPGLAHFCEHLLFMGTEHYPRENEYSEYLSKNNGSSNAYTGTSNTNYFFSVSTSALSGALSRFSAFFHSPLFAPSCTARELNAVDSEHKKNHQSDVWRIFQMNKHLSKEGHVWNKFGSGNRDSLSKVGRELKAKGLLKSNGADSVTPNGSLTGTPIPSRVPSPAPSSNSSTGESEGDGGVVGRETRRRLVEWWSKEYCASRMRLCVIGKESLDDLSDLVSTLFSSIPNRGLDALPMINDHPFGPNETGTLVSVQTVMSFHALEISFPLAYQPPFYRHQPGNFLAHFVGHEGPGSLHSYLKHKGWIIALSAGPQPLARGFAMFKVTLRLTKEGFDNHRAISLAVYKYLALLRSSKFPPWYQHEISTIKSIRFRFAEKRRPEDYAVWAAEQMAWPVPRDLILSAPQLVEEWDAEDSMKPGGGEKEVRDVLEGLRVEKGRSVLMARKEEHERLVGADKVWESEPWYGTPYRVERYDEEFIEQSQGPNDIPDMFLPGPNEFIPTNLEVDKREVDKPLKRPHLIRETPLSSLWHKKDDQFWVPRAQVIMEIRSPVANESARASVMTRLYAELVTDSLTEFSYDADLAGLTYNFGSHNLGVSITLNGYNDKLHVLAKDIFERARNLTISPERLHAKQQEVKRDWENFFLDQPYRLSDYFARYILTEKQWTLAEKLAEVASITPEELQTYINKFLSQVNLRALVVGNMYKDEAIRLVEMTEQILQSSPLPPNEVIERSLIPAPGSNTIWPIPVPNPNEPNSALSYYVHIGSVLSPRLRVVAALTSQIISEPAFNVLRTREQLGYIVSSSQWTSTGQSEIGLRIVVQSERDPAYLEERVEAFLDEMKEKLEGMSEDDVNEQKAGLEKRWREAVKNMSEETNRYWPHLDSGYLDFLRRDHDADLLHSIVKEDVVSFFLTRIHPSSSNRAKLSVHLKSKKPRPKKMSLQALTALEQSATEKGLAIDFQKWRKELTGDGEPLLDQAVDSFKHTLTDEGKTSSEVVQELLAGIPSLVEKYPAESESSGKIASGATLIDDPKALKATLRKSDPPEPVVVWGDLPTSKY